MSVTKKILLVFVSLILIASLVSFGILWSVHTLLYSQVYENSLAKNNAYDLINSTSQFLQGGFIKIPDGGMKSLVNMFLENTLSYLRGDVNQLNLTLQIDTNNLTNFFLNNINILPPCNTGQIPFYGNIPTCKPSNINSSAFLDIVLKQNNFTINQTVNLADVYGLKGDNISQIKNYIGIYQIMLYGSIILVVILAILIFFISNNWLRVVGIDLFISGLFVYIFSSSTAFVPLSNIPSEIGFVQIIAKDLIDNLILRVRLFSYIVLGIGIVIFALSFLIKSKRKMKKSQ